jgi:hypothetical protein
LTIREIRGHREIRDREIRDREIRGHRRRRKGVAKRR